ncbi:MAG: hypothetical protein J1F16_06240 [Muribaculaceae bacterium]|nr:hypothetical protein [Muribaculaceae bacterium]
MVHGTWCTVHGAWCTVHGAQAIIPMIYGNMIATGRIPPMNSCGSLSVMSWTCQGLNSNSYLYYKR